MLMEKHTSATCPECGESLFFGTKEEATGWKVYYECNDHCGFEVMAGRVSLSKIEQRDEVYERAHKMGERWGGP